MFAMTGLFPHKTRAVPLPGTSGGQREFSSRHVFLKRIFILLLILVFSPIEHAPIAAHEADTSLPPPFDRYLPRRVAEMASPDWQKEITLENEPAKQAGPIDEPARSVHAPRDLKVFAGMSRNGKVTLVDKSFVPAQAMSAEPPATTEWPRWRDGRMEALRRDCFRAWPSDGSKGAVRHLAVQSKGGLRLLKADFSSESDIPLTLWVLHRDDLPPKDLDMVVLNTLGDDDWKKFRNLAAAGFPDQFPGAAPDQDAFSEEREMLLATRWAMAYVCPRGAGPASWASLLPEKQIHLRRRLLLLGESLESGQVWDITCAAAALRTLPGFAGKTLWLQAQRTMAANTLYASLFIPNVHRLDLHSPPATHRDGPVYLHVLRHLDLPEAAALAAERSTVAIYTKEDLPWRYAQRVSSKMGWGEARVQIRRSLDTQSSAAR